MTFDKATLPPLSIAIVGLAARVPGARDAATFWHNVANRVSSIVRISDDDLLAAGIDARLLESPEYVKAGTFIEDIDRFDAPFFGFTPREAEGMDPQSRVLLQCAWEALEDGGYDPYAYPGPIGIFAGKSFQHYLTSNLMTNPEVVGLLGDLQVAAGTERDALASLVAYKLDLKGPSVSVQTFCSTSLVAVHLACQSLLAFECDVALAGGVALQVPHKVGYQYVEGGLFAPDGECLALDAAANGSVPGNGVGMVALRRLEDALESGDQIYAVIRGSAINNDGRARVGFAAPGTQGQAAVIAAALANAGVGAESLGYVETHGMGTPMGDAVELAAMHAVFSEAGVRPRSCAIGSVKPNIGHADRASGVLSLIKVAMALKHGQLPPSLNCSVPNPAIGLDSPLYVNTTLQAWPRLSGARRRAGVSSFGLGGTNAHVVLEEAPDTSSSATSRPHQLVVLSAKTEAALDQLTTRLAAHLSAHPDLDLADVAYTLQLGRAAFNHRRFVVAWSTEDTVRALEGAEPERMVSENQTSRERSVCFAFQDHTPELGAVSVELYATEPGFREAVEACCTFVDHRKAEALRATFQGGALDQGDVSPRLVTFVVEYALVQLLGEWGVRPAAVVGKGVGELVAACVAEMLDLSEALRLVDGAAWSGQIDQLDQTDHALLEVGVGLSITERLLGALGRLWLAGVSVDWQGVWKHEQRQRLSLPTYPFEHYRYWIEPRKAREAPLPRPNDGTAKRPNIGEWFYLPSWQQRPPWSDQDLAAARSTGPDDGLAVVFLDGLGLGERLTQRLEAMGYTTARVEVGNRFDALAGKLRFQLDPDDPGGYRTLMQSLPSPPSRIIHLWALNSPADLACGPELFAYTQRLAYYSLLYLAKALERSPEPVSLWLVTGNAQPISGEEALSAELAPALGLCRVIPQENLHISCRSVDVGLPLQSDWRIDRLASQLLGEVVRDPGDLTVAYRGTQRWTQSFEPITLNAPRQPVLRLGGAYLISGGLGGIGMLLIRYLGETFRARLAITTRSVFPDREMWAEWLAAHPTDDVVSQRIRLLESVEAVGAEVLVLQADCSDAAQMSDVVAEVEARFGALHGVLHLAGVSSDFAPLHDLQVEQCEAHFRPKAYGLYALERVLADRQLDFCMLWSSLASVLGGLESGGYTAANGFVDSFVHRHNRSNRGWWTAVNWDAWRTRADEHPSVGATVAQFQMEPEEAIQAFERVLGHGGLTQVVTSTGDLEARLDQWLRRIGAASNVQGVESVERHPRAELETPFAAPTNATEERIAAIWQEVMGIDSIGINDQFLELGGHSLMATQIVSRVRQAFQVSLPLSQLFLAPTVAELAIAVELAIIEELEGMPEMTSAA